MSKSSGDTTSSEKFNLHDDKVSEEEDETKEKDLYILSQDMFESENGKDDNPVEDENSVAIIEEIQTNKNVLQTNDDDDVYDLKKRIREWQEASVFYKQSTSTGLKRKDFDNSQSILGDEPEKDSMDKNKRRKQAWRKEDNYSEEGENTSSQKSESLEPEENPSFHMISDLVDKELNITDKDVEKVLRAGYSTVESFLFSPRKTLVQIRGLSEDKIDRMIKLGNQKTGMIYITTATEYHTRRSQILCITTGSKALDRLLGNGIETGSITEIYGQSATGKTQLCHMLAVACQLPPERGGADGKCIYMSTDPTFRPQRLADVAKRYKLDEDMVLNNVIHARVRNVDHQTNLLVEAAARMTESRFALMIIDSCTALYRTDYNGIHELNARQIHLANFLRVLLRLADQFGVAVVITNEMTANMSGSTMYGDTNVPIGGNIIAHASVTRLCLRKGRGTTRFCRLASSPCLAESETTFCITTNGIEDVPE